MSLPSGTVTFLFTDIEGSTRHWEEHPEAMREALARHNALLTEIIQRYNGSVFNTVGDAIYAVFHTPTEALLAAIDAQRLLAGEDFSRVGGLRVRMAIHTGAAEADAGDYYGASLSHVDRLLHAAWGSQVLLSESAVEKIEGQLPEEAQLIDLGSHRLKDMREPLRIFQLAHPALPEDKNRLRSLKQVPNNLPLQLTRFVGRETQLRELERLLPRTRLLTLTGTGGCGKTRLALQLAAELLEVFPEGVWLVDMAPLSQPDLVEPAVLASLGLPEQPDRPLLETLLEYLQPRTLLLILDNCEHLLDVCARLTQNVLLACARVSILATSREALNVAGERVWPVSALSYPEAGEPAQSQALPEYEAIRLFVDRASFQQPGFQMTDQNANAVAQICRRVEGIPLAVELAAARLNVLSVDQIARFDDYFHLLSAGARSLPARHQTLQATLDWGYNLLSEKEQALLHRLSVFAGGWTLEAAEQVCAYEDIQTGEILDLMARLIRASLVVAEEQEGVKRYRMLETIREYGHRQLEALGRVDLQQQRHLDYFLALAEQAKAGLMGAEQGVWLDRLEREYTNLRAALAWCVATTDRAEAGLRIASALARFWTGRSHFSEGRHWCAALLAHPDAQSPTEARADVLSAKGLLAVRQGDYPAARALQEESLALSRQLGYQVGIARSLNNLGIVFLDQEEYAKARSCLEEALALNRELGNQAWEAMNLGNLGIIANRQGDLEGARRQYEEARRLHKTSGNKAGQIVALIALGGTLVDMGDAKEACAILAEGLALCREVGEQWAIPPALINLANAARLQGAPERAVRLYGAEEALRAALGTPRAPREKQGYEQDRTALRAALGEEIFAVVWEQGQAMALDQAIVYALEEKP